MKKFSILVSLLLVILLSCSKQRIDCTAVSYDESFTMEINEKYCFPDGNYIIAKKFKNEFCAYLAHCKWAGEMSLHLEAFIDGSLSNYNIGSSVLTNSYIIENDEKYRVNFSDIIFEEPASAVNQQPDILRVNISINN